MADVKISALPASTTPVAGTEVLPIVQGGVTKQVTIANLTAGRAVAGLSFNATNGLTSTGGTLGIGTASPSGTAELRVASPVTLKMTNTNGTGYDTTIQATYSASESFSITTGTAKILSYSSTGTGGGGTTSISAGAGAVAVVSSSAPALYLNGTSGTNAVGFKAGTGSAGALEFYTNSAEKMRLTITGNLYPSTTSTTSMTDGFFYIPAAAGAPSGVPTAISGKVPMYYDSTNNFFYIYNGAWKKVLLA